MTTKQAVQAIKESALILEILSTTPCDGSIRSKSRRLALFFRATRLQRMAVAVIAGTLAGRECERTSNAA